MNRAIWDRGKSTWLVNSVLIPTSILIVLQASIYRDDLGNLIAGLFSMISFVLAMYCLVHYRLSDKVNKECWKRINQIEEILGIEGNRGIHSKIRSTYWYFTRRWMWDVFFLLLLALDLSVAIWNFWA